MIRYFHVRNPYGGGGFTVAYEEEMNSVEYGVGYCSPKDQFNKLNGRMNALFRLDRDQELPNFKTKGIVTLGAEFENLQHIKYHILLDILFSPETQKHFIKSIIADELLFMANRYIN
jgi:hypothetical protein